MIDHEKDREQHDHVALALAALDEREKHIAYMALYNMGHRVERAPHEIARLAPRLPKAS